MNLARTLGALLLLVAWRNAVAGKEVPATKESVTAYSLSLGDSSYLVFRFPKEIYYCPSDDRSGSASRFGGPAFHWMSIPDIQQRGTDAHFWVELVEGEGKLQDQALTYLRSGSMTTPFNKVSSKLDAVMLKTLSIGDKTVLAYTATYTSSLVHSLDTEAHAVGTFWMFDIDGRRVVMQADSYSPLESGGEPFDPAPILLKALWWYKQPVQGEFRMAQAGASTYYYLTMSMPAGWLTTPVKDGSLVRWAIVGPHKENIAAFSIRQEPAQGLDPSELRIWLKAKFKEKNSSMPDDAIKPYKLAGKDGITVETTVPDPDDPAKSSLSRLIYVVDGEFIKEFSAISYGTDKAQAEAQWKALDGALANAKMWTVK